MKMYIYLSLSQKGNDDMQGKNDSMVFNNFIE